jgi:hypothetical protein
VAAREFKIIAASGSLSENRKEIKQWLGDKCWSSMTLRHNQSNYYISESGVSQFWKH